MLDQRVQIPFFPGRPLPPIVPRTLPSNLLKNVIYGFKGNLPLQETPSPVSQGTSANGGFNQN